MTALGLCRGLCPDLVGLAAGPFGCWPCHIRLNLVPVAVASGPVLDFHAAVDFDINMECSAIYFPSGPFSAYRLLFLLILFVHNPQKERFATISKIG